MGGPQVVASRVQVPYVTFMLPAGGGAVHTRRLDPWAVSWTALSRHQPALL